MGKSTVEALLAGWSSCSSLELPLSKYLILLYWRYILTRSWWEALLPGPGGASIPRYSRIMLFRASNCRPLYISSCSNWALDSLRQELKITAPTERRKHCAIEFCMASSFCLCRLCVGQCNEWHSRHAFIYTGTGHAPLETIAHLHPHWNFTYK